MAQLIWHVSTNFALEKASRLAPKYPHFISSHRMLVYFLKDVGSGTLRWSQPSGDRYYLEFSEPHVSWTIHCEANCFPIS
jgi:hypothetical protein